MIPRERVLASLSRESVDRPPVTCMTTSVTVDQEEAIGVYWPEAHTDPVRMSRLAMAAYKVVGFESVRIPFCLTVEAEIMGCNVDLGRKDRTPMVKSHPFGMGDTLSIPERMGGRAAVTVEATRLLRAEVGNQLPVITLAVGPFTIAGHLVGTENLLLWTLLEREEARRFIRFTTELSGIYLTELDEAGADIILLSDPSASADMISPDTFEELSLPATRGCLASVRKAMTVLHICGDTTALLDHMIATGVDALSIEEKVDPYRAVEIVNGRAALVGNIGVVKPLLVGSHREIVEATRRVIEAGFQVINPGCGLAPGIPLENLQAMVLTVKGSYR